MNKLLSVLEWVNQNLPLILAAVAVVIGIVVKVKRFLRMSEDEKRSVIQQKADIVVKLIRQELLYLVTQAEREWGDGTGRIKKSWVWEQLLKQYSSLCEFIENGMIERAYIDELIEEAVAELQHLLKTNDKVAAIVEGASGLPEGG